MKKFVTLLFFIVFIQNVCFATTSVSFVYINGSNNNNEKMHKWFVKGIDKFHPVLKKRMEHDKYVSKHFLKDNDLIIEENPSIFFWGYKSQTDLMFMKEKANLLRSVSPLIAYFVRNTIAEMLHDAIWVQKSHNMISIIQDLDKQIKQKSKEGKKVVLFGYSAGSFVTMEYLFNKMPYINLSEYFNNVNLDKDLVQMINENPRKDTCLMAFVGSNLTNASPLGKIIVNKNKKEFKSAYMNMDRFTDKYCAPQDTILGVVNYASPIPLFYSDMADENLGAQKFNHMMFKYLIEQDFFFLTVNYADDPLGFPNGVNYTNEQIKNITKLEYDQEKGFFYDYSKALSWRTFVGAHTSYWKTKKHFSKAIIKAYKEGREFQYGGR